ncbi:glycosyltransferase [Paraflavisolibacter sp. H34]|uniref:glycosyltransferase n=1 Tax=Huijunlia imazamoxiresistens TaxID=3127457 RepID=UPI003019634E
MQTIDETRILVAPLDWGLGHATRCIPVIHELLKRKYTVLIAAEGKTAVLLQQEFPELPLIKLSGYGIRYAKTRWGVLAALLLQIPRILSAIRRERHWLDHIVAAHRIDIVLSDNRYGLYHPKAYSIFMTHQLLIKTPRPLFDAVLQKINYRLIRRFRECWVPDRPEAPGLAGELSHPADPPATPLFYTGALSRFRLGPPVPPKHLLVLLSGPEPQRSLLEEKLLRQLRSYTQPVVFVRGLPGEEALPAAPPHIFLKNHLPAPALEQVLAEAGTVISRCGYSTVMDLACLGKKSILVPTPGQTEQEYLSRHLMQAGLALCLPQDKFELEAALELAATFPYRFLPEADGQRDQLSTLLDGLPQRVKKRPA